MRRVDVMIEIDRYDRLNKIADEQKVPIGELLSTRGVDLLLTELDADIPRAAAAVVAALDFRDLDKLTAIVEALHKLRVALPQPRP